MPNFDDGSCYSDLNDFGPGECGCWMCKAIEPVEYGSWDWYMQRIGMDNANFAMPCPDTWLPLHDGCACLDNEQRFEDWFQLHLDNVPDGRETETNTPREVMERIAEGV